MKVNLKTNCRITFICLHPKDLAYKKLLQKGLQDSFCISCNPEDLNAVAGPFELKQIINKLKPEHYQVGEKLRANFHLHTISSDGRLTPKEFLEQCTSYANRVFKSGKANDDLPAFSAAITDHDRVKSSQEVIALISQEPGKYKNFKFVAGCEFLLHGYKEPHPAFEAVGLGFNPFDKSLETLMKGFASNNQVSDIPKIKNAGGILSWAHPIVTPDKINDDFFEFLKKHGIDGVEGNYQYNRWDKEYVDSIKPMREKLIKKFKMFVTGGTDCHTKSLF
ncbi:pHP domain protein [Clostridium sp. CAG:768]|nr:pHP domain protein [Clostridium sp. CAG:768]